MNRIGPPQPASPLIRREAAAPARPASLRGHYAGLVSRSLAFVMDAMILSATLVFITWFTQTALDMLFRPLLAELLHRLTGWRPIFNVLFNSVAASLLSFFFVVAYHVFFWRSAGQTPGKAILGLRIVPLEGGKLPVWRAILRYLAYFISTFALGLGFWWMLVDERRMGWHDKIARTCVVYIWDAQPDERFLVHSIQELRSRSEALRSLLSRRKRLKDDLHSAARHLAAGSEGEPPTQDIPHK